MEEFLVDTFDELEFANRAIESNSVSDSLERLSRLVANLKQDIRGKVKEQYDELLDQLQFTQQLEDVMGSVKTGSAAIRHQVNVVIQDIGKPFETIRERTEQLHRLQTSSDLVRRVIRFITLVRKLRTFTGPRDLPKAAQSLFEIDTLLKEADLTGIELVDVDLPWLATTRDGLWKQTRSLLQHGLHTDDSQDVATALQVFYHMGSFLPEINALRDRIISECAESLDATLGAKRLVQTGRSIWVPLEQCMHGLQSQCAKMWQVQRVLSESRDPTTLARLADALGEEGTIIPDFWRKFTDMVHDQLTITTRHAKANETMFIQSFPKLLSLLKDFWRRLAKLVHNNDVSMERQLLAAASFLRREYISNAQRRFAEVIQLILSDGLTSNTVQHFVDVIADVLADAGVDDVLLQEMATVVSKALKTVAVKCDAQVRSDADATAITQQMAPAQEDNIKLFNALCKLHGETTTALDPYSDHVVEAMGDGLGQVERTARRIISELFDAAAATFDRIVTFIHREDLNRTSDGRSSDYMHSLQTKLASFVQAILGKTADNALVRQKRRELAERILSMFVRNASLVRNLREAGRLVLASDIAELENSIAPLMSVKELGVSYRMLRALRVLLFLKPDEFMSTEHLSQIDVLPRSVVIHHLMSHAPPALLLPHTHKAWPLPKYVEWLDTHSEEETLTLIHDAVKASTGQMLQDEASQKVIRAVKQLIGRP
eukprot:TRINITY_DN9064_c0_g1_i1.p1 TRINITY_DN9064_c0_g1~~TRINITY_DN9064_c0_g1_i1.p1  ORF type:complete len:718 (-),score=163.99 TRINITY_DN9064_c0_g1_i1:181-2334(-)